MMNAPRQCTPSQARAGRSRCVLKLLACWLIVGTAWMQAAEASARNFTDGADVAVKFGVHEVTLAGDDAAANPFDTIATVTFMPPSGAAKAKTVNAFFDGGSTWRARVYVSEPGEWKWSSRCATDTALHGKQGSFTAADSKLRGRLLIHSKNPSQWMTEDGRWFLNLNDTAYFLLCARDGSGAPVSDEQARQYVRDDAAHGITSLRCFLASRRGGFAESREQWIAWHFADGTRDQLRLEATQCADRRLRMLLDEFPDVAVQLILFPLEGYAQDDHFWAALSPVQRERLLRNLVARFAAYPQLFWLMTNDAHYGEKHPRNNAMVREVGAYLQKHDPWQHPRSTGHARRVPFYFGAEDWATYIHIEHAHDLGAAEMGKYRAFAKPVFLGEDRYEQDHGPSRDPAHMDYWQRRLFWTWLLAGGSANYGGRWWCVQPYSQTGKLPATRAVKLIPKNPFTAPLTGLDSVAHIRDYFTRRGIELSDFQPDDALVKDADDATGVRAPKLARRARSEFLIYHPHADPALDDQHTRPIADKAAAVIVDLSAAQGRFAVEWLRTDTGATESGKEVPGGTLLPLRAPWPGVDCVLRLSLLID